MRIPFFVIELKLQLIDKSFKQPITRLNSIISININMNRCSIDVNRLLFINANDYLYSKALYQQTIRDTMWNATIVFNEIGIDRDYSQTTFNNSIPHNEYCITTLTNRMNFCRYIFSIYFHI